MKIGFLYAGQGSQHVGMGKDFYEAFPVFRETLDRVKADFDVKKVSFEGPQEVLNETRFTQPCMVAFAVGLTKVLAEMGIKPAVAAGLSLGEYSALYAAGVLSEEAAVPLVAFRGQEMQKAAEGRDTKMIAVLGLDREKVFEGTARVAEEMQGSAVAEPANFNCPGQITVSGDAAAVDRAAEVLKELGAKRCLPVKVSGPFHTSLMKPAGDALRERFRKESFGEMQIPVILNAVGREKTAEETIPDLLEKQVQSSVYFEDTLRVMKDMGVGLFVEIGPGSTLSKFVAKTTPDVPCVSIDKVEDLEKLKEYAG